MPIPEEYSREERTIRLARRVGLVLAVLVLLLVVFARVEPESLSRIWTADNSPVESGLTAGAEGADAQGRGPETAAAQTVAQDTGTAANLAAGAVAPDDPAPSVRGAQPEVATDVILLPCSTVNPRADGSFIIPPHDPTHRTVIGLRSGAGRKRQGYVVPPHDPGEENQVAIEVISMDSILDKSLQVPPHNPRATNYARPYQRPCKGDAAP